MVRWLNSKAGKWQGKKCNRCHHAFVDLLQVLLWCLKMQVALLCWTCCRHLILWRLKLTRSAGNPKFLMRGPTPQEKVSLWTFLPCPYFLSTAHISFALFLQFWIMLVRWPSQCNDQSNEQSYITQRKPSAASNWPRGDTPLLTIEIVFSSNIPLNEVLSS